MTDKKEGRSRGFGFVSYETPEMAREAIKRVNGKSVLGKRLKVELKQGNGKFFGGKEDMEATTFNLKSLVGKVLKDEPNNCV